MVLSGHQVLLMLYIKGFCLSDDHGDGDGDSDGDGDGGDDACDSISSIWSLSALLHTYKSQSMMLPFLMNDNI